MPHLLTDLNRRVNKLAVNVAPMPICSVYTRQLLLHYASSISLAMPLRQPYSDRSGFSSFVLGSQRHNSADLLLTLSLGARLG